MHPDDRQCLIARSAVLQKNDDMLFDFAFEGDTWLIEAEYDSDWLAVVQLMCELCDAHVMMMMVHGLKGLSDWTPPGVRRSCRVRSLPHIRPMALWRRM